MNLSVQEQVEHFINNEKQFHLGALPTEQSNPKTKNLSQTFQQSTPKGVQLLQSVDRDVVTMLDSVLNSQEFDTMVSTCIEALQNNRKLIFSGCGATGRLSILLESMWRKFFIELKQQQAEHSEVLDVLENQVFSIMTGGDYALIRSVESFEDYSEFGKQQARELNIGKGDVLIGITEGGETSSVLGTIIEAKDSGAATFILFNNPADILCEHVERSKAVIMDPDVTVLDLYCGPMALAGSTRMQATTSEMLVAGIAMEQVLIAVLKEKNITIPDSHLAIQDYTHDFKKLLDELEKAESVKVMADCIEFEEDIYNENGLITYYADKYLLDIFTDTTERAPTFMLPPFRKHDDLTAQSSWAFVKNPCYSTHDAWLNILGRKTRCLDWTTSLYQTMRAPETIASDPPQLNQTELFKFLVGNEDDPSRFTTETNAAVAVYTANECNAEYFEKFTSAFTAASKNFQQQKSIQIGGSAAENADYHIPCTIKNTPLDIWEHIAVKLVLNTVSTGTMAIMGRVEGNWMAWVESSNKKLIDRSTRLISEIGNVSYKEACTALFQAIDDINKQDWSNKERPSPVQYALRKVKGKNIYFTYRSFLKELDTVKKFHEIGINTVCLFPANTDNSLGTPYCEYESKWVWHDTYYFDPVDQEFDDVLNVNPDAEFLVMIDLNTPLWWTRQHGGYDSMMHLGHVIHQEKWRHDTANYMEAFINYTDKKYGNKIKAYILACGGTDEWQDRTHGEEGHIREKAFRNWSKSKNLPDPSRIPEYSERNHCSHDMLRDPESDKRSLNYWKFCSESTVDSIQFFAERARATMPARTELGVFYGYIIELGQQRLVSEGYLDYERLCETPGLDFIIGPGTYQDRDMGGGSGFMVPRETIRAKGLQYLHECDQRTHSCNLKLSKHIDLGATTGCWSRWADEQATIAGLRREMALCLIEKTSLWWFDMWGGWYQGENVLGTLKQMKEIWDNYINMPIEETAEVLMVVDPESTYYLNENDERIDHFNRETRNKLNRLGAPFRICSFNDLPNLPNLNRYKFIIFTSTFNIDQKQETILKEHVLRDNRTVLWLYAPGIIHNNTYNEEQVGKISGIKYGSEGLNKQDMDNWISAYIHNPMELSVEDLQELAKSAGVHIYTDHQVPIFANNKFLAIHTAEPLEATIKLPKQYKRVKNLFTNQDEANETDSFTISLEGPDTALFELV